MFPTKRDLKLTKSTSGESKEQRELSRLVHKGILRNASLRESCLDFPVKPRCSNDITFSVFWKYEFEVECKSHPNE